MLYFAYKYSDSAEKALLAISNSGGDNIARAALVGALFGASFGIKAFPTWTKDLLVKRDIYYDEI
jgi:ADP-ribosylglycohydrolase